MEQKGNTVIWIVYLSRGQCQEKSLNLWPSAGDVFPGPNCWNCIFFIPIDQTNVDIEELYNRIVWSVLQVQTPTLNQILRAIHQITINKKNRAVGFVLKNVKMCCHAVRIRQTVNLPQGRRSRKSWLSVEGRESSDYFDTHFRSLATDCLFSVFRARSANPSSMYLEYNVRSSHLNETHP